MQGIDCQGATPTGGPTLPAIVATGLQPTATILRILNASGAGFTGPVEVNCTIDSQSPTATSAFAASPEPSSKRAGGWLNRITSRFKGAEPAKQTNQP